jgi:hypothetical protein
MNPRFVFPPTEPIANTLMHGQLLVVAPWAWTGITITPYCLRRDDCRSPQLKPYRTGTHRLHCFCALGAPLCFLAG